MAEIPNELKPEIARRLGCFEGPAEVVRWLKAEHELDATIRQIMAYDAAGVYFVAGDEYRQIFDAARKAWLHDVAVIPIAQQGFRLNTLQTMLAQALRQKNLVLGASLLEQAAKEIGGSFSNVRVNVGDLQALTMEERRAQFARLCDTALGHDKAQTAPSVETPQ